MERKRLSKPIVRLRLEDEPSPPQKTSGDKGRSQTVGSSNDAAKTDQSKTRQLRDRPEKRGRVFLNPSTTSRAQFREPRDTVAPQITHSKSSVSSAQDAITRSAKVGPGNPPKKTQFRPGVSGNPLGRPKGSKNLATILEEAARRKVKATIDGKPRRITTVQATAFQLATKAANGDPKAMSQYLDWIDEVEQRAEARRPAAFPMSLEDRKILVELYRRMTQAMPRKKK